MTATDDASGEPSGKGADGQGVLSGNNKYMSTQQIYGPCAGALADESPKSKIIQKCQNVN